MLPFTFFLASHTYIIETNRGRRRLCRSHFLGGRKGKTAFPTEDVSQLSGDEKSKRVSSHHPLEFCFCFFLCTHNRTEATNIMFLI